MFYRLGLIGFPIQHSLSPAIQDAAFRNIGLQGEYNLYSCPQTREGILTLKRLLNSMRDGELNGLNVTIPHKQTILPYLDELTTQTSFIGAINTVYYHRGMLVGDNTDALGFYCDLCRVSQGKLNRKTALVLGAGGSARGVSYILLNNGWKVIVAARRNEQARQLVSEQKKRFAQIQIEISLEATTIDKIKYMFSELSDVTLVVNCTPLGMNPVLELSAWPEEVNIPSQALAYDLVYKPVETRFMRLAKSNGCQAFNGTGMLIEQALLAFEKWTGKTPHRQDVRSMLSLEGVIP
jgi:shikimate dehydrogenase